MILRILAMIAHEFAEQYRKLDKEPEHADESVVSFNTALNPAQVNEVAGCGSIGFNKRTTKD